MPSLSLPLRQRIDRMGVVVSGLCLLHCAASIALLALFGFGGELLAPQWHEWGLAIAMLIAVVSIGWGANQHRQAGPVWIAIVGLAFMATALTMPHGVGEIVVTMIGVALVSVGHLLNLRCSR